MLCLGVWERVQYHRVTLIRDRPELRLVAPLGLVVPTTMPAILRTRCSEAEGDGRLLFQWCLHPALSACILLLDLTPFDQLYPLR